jgi:hypothetical protein
MAPIGYGHHRRDHLVLLSINGRSGDISEPKVAKA